MSSTTEAITSGGCDTLGMKSGCLNSDGKSSMIYRGIEDIYGNVWQFIDGLNVKNNVVYISYNSSDYAVDKFDGSYKALGYTCPSANNWIKELGYDESNPLIGLPLSIGGGNNTYVTDYYWQSEGNRIARFGGRWNFGLSCGFWFWILDGTSGWTGASGGSRLLFNQ